MFSVRFGIMYVLNLIGCNKIFKFYMGLENCFIFGNILNVIMIYFIILF